MDPQVDTEQARHTNLAASFFQCFTLSCLFRGLARVDMTTGLVDDHYAGGSLLDHQELPIIFNDSGHCQVSRQHGELIFCLDAELTEFDFDFACLPNFVKHLSVELGDSGFVGVCNTFPAFVLQTINKRRFISDAK